MACRQGPWPWLSETHHSRVSHDSAIIAGRRARTAAARPRGLGLAIGVAVAGAFRVSDLENEWIGEFSDDVKADLNTRAGAVSKSLREASDTLKAELGDTGAKAVDWVKQAGMDAADAAREKIMSS